MVWLSWIKDLEARKSRWENARAATALVDDCTGNIDWNVCLLHYCPNNNKNVRNNHDDNNNNNDNYNNNNYNNNNNKNNNNNYGYVYYNIIRIIIKE